MLASIGTLHAVSSVVPRVVGGSSGGRALARPQGCKHDSASIALAPVAEPFPLSSSSSASASSGSTTFTSSSPSRGSGGGPHGDAQGERPVADGSGDGLSARWMRMHGVGGSAARGATVKAAHVGRGAASRSEHAQVATGRHGLARDSQRSVFADVGAGRRLSSSSSSSSSSSGVGSSSSL